MRGPKPDPLSLTEVERNALERLVRRPSTSQQLALRGRIILEANAGKNNSQIARELGASRGDGARLAQRLAGLAEHRAG